MNQPTCPTHGQQYYRFHEKYGAGCSFKGGVGQAGMNANGYCAWTPGKGNGAEQPQRASAPRSNYVPDPAKDRSIVAQVAMKAAARLYAGMMVQRDGPKDRVDMLAEMISAAHRINENIQRMSEPAPKPHPRPAAAHFDSDQGYTPDEEYGDLESGRYDT